jgi:hydroxymethylglutaryl-CoA lyase
LSNAANLQGRAVAICEVSPRDGLQNEKTPVSTADKLRLINALVAAGAKRIEATSFVNPSRVPQMADAEAVMAAVPRGNGVRWSGLALNRRGAERAIAAACDEITCVLVASESFGIRNQGQAVAEGQANWAEVAPLIHAAGRIPTLTIATAFGCPFEGVVDPDIVTRIIAEAAAFGPAEISLADTIGVATPNQVSALFARAAAAAPGVVLRGHFHNTRNTGYANAHAALLAGATVLDSSAGGMHGINRDAIAALDPFLAGILGHPVPGLLGKTDPWPPVSVQS